MPACTICTNPKRKQIDAAIVADGASVRHVAERFGLSASALGRHRKNHLAPALAKHEERFDLATAAGIGRRLETIHTEATRLLQEAREDGNRRDQLAALARLERQIEIAGKLAALIQDGQHVAVSVSATDSWPALRTVILKALEPHTEARRDVLAALESEGRQ